MGCAPSSSHRRIGLHDPFAVHNSVMPLNPGEPAWAAPSFHGDYRHTADLSAFLSTTAPLPPPVEEPPPYTEQLLEGHTSLMMGGKPTQPDKDGEDDEVLDSVADSSQLTTRDVGILDRTQQDIEQDVSYQGTIPNATEAMRASSTSERVATADQIRASNQAMMITLTRSSMRVESPRMDCENPFPDTHSTNYTTVPFFQRPIRSHSIDNGGISVATDTHQREHLPAILATPFPPRQLAASHPSSINNPQEMVPPLRRLWNPNNPLQTTRPPSRLPPLQSSTDRSGSQRKRHKRKRGHSWHGERISSQAIAVTAMESVAE